MTRTELDLIRRALQLLHKIVPDDDEPCAVYAAARRCPVILFAKRYLMRQPGADATTDELWKFYAEIAASGELEPLSKAEFLRRLTGAMLAVFGANKCHSIRRDKQTVRGFKSVNLRMDTCSPSVLEIEPEGDEVSGTGWAELSGGKLTGRIAFHLGDESGFVAQKAANS